jgi:putative transposase
MMSASSPDGIVIIDNLASHLGVKLKHWLRKAAKRTFEAVSRAIGQTLDTVTSAEGRNYFRNSGYEPV